MSSFHNNHPLRVLFTNLRRRFLQQQQQPSSSCTQNEITSHYQHGIPGIPTDGKVVLLKNSKNGAQLYLVGTIHVSKHSAETVKKVINYVRPRVVGVELCKRRASTIYGLMNWKPEDATLYKLLCSSMRGPGRLCWKIYNFILFFGTRRLLADGILPGLEFKVAMEESSAVGARCICIDQHIDVIHQKLFKVSCFHLLWKMYHDYRVSVHPNCVDEKYTRAFVREKCRIQKNRWPDVFQVRIEDRDKFMFKNLRSFEGKVVAVVGMGHMDGIELLWRRAEEDGSSSIST